MVLDKLPVPGRRTIRMIVGQGPIALVVGEGGSCLDIFTLLYLSPSFWETARYRLKFCLKGPLNPKQLTNQYIVEVQPYMGLQPKRAVLSEQHHTGAVLFGSTTK